MREFFDATFTNVTADLRLHGCRLAVDTVCAIECTVREAIGIFCASAANSCKGDDIVAVVLADFCSRTVVIDGDIACVSIAEDVSEDITVAVVVCDFAA